MFLVLALVLQAAPEAPPPDLQDILQKMFSRLAHDAQRQIAGATWTKKRMDEDITDNPLYPKVEHREEFRVWGDGARMLQQKISRDGRRVSEKPQALPFFLEPSMLQRFTFTLDEPASVPCGNRECYRISFMPQPGAIHGDDDIEQVLLNASVGTLLVDTGHFGIVRADAHTVLPYESFKVDVFWFTVSLTQVQSRGVMVTVMIEMSYAYDPLFGGPKTKKRVYEYVDISVPPSE